MLSGGPRWLGIGAGISRTRRPPSACRDLAERFERLGETLRIALAMWSCS